MPVNSQIALFAIPFAVVVGWMTGHNFSLDFDAFGVIALVLSVIHTNNVTSDANSNWLQVRGVGVGCKGCGAGCGCGCRL